MENREAGPSPAALIRLAELLEREAHAFALVADFNLDSGPTRFAKQHAATSAQNYLLAAELRCRAAALHPKETPHGE